ncbi:unnamed protein product [Dovyalis caffra]|uniref:Uncharacterized protein n=1 Tax=Dovyalis caffra TaxID=77055 RepID=A0AAV1S7N7_9ROSI|nr:unnamed protein product [Dovyalis caffra]
MREDPHSETDPNEKLYGVSALESRKLVNYSATSFISNISCYTLHGDNQYRNSVQALEFKHLNVHGGGILEGARYSQASCSISS